jgi:hypothetical protein
MPVYSRLSIFFLCVLSGTPSSMNRRSINSTPVFFPYDKFYATFFPTPPNLRTRSSVELPSDP